MIRSALLCLLLPLSVVAAEPLKDREGNPLPEGALMRLGTTSFRLGTANQHHGGMAVSRDGKRVAVLEPGKIHVWEVETGKLVREFDHTDSAEAPDLLAISPDGRILLIANRRFGIQARSAETGEILFSHGSTDDIERGDIQSDPPRVGFLADGTPIYCRNEIGLNARFASIHDAKTKKELHRFESDSQGRLSIELLPDGKTILGRISRSDGFHGDFRFYDATTFKIKSRINGLEIIDPLRSSGSSSDGSVIYQLDREFNLTFWNTKDASLRGNLAGKRGDKEPDRCFLSWDGKFAVVNSATDYSIRTFDTSTGKELQRLEGIALLGPTTISKDGSRLISRGYNRVEIWDLTTGKAMHLRDGDHLQPPRNLIYSPDGKYLAGNVDGRICIWQTSDWKRLSRWEVKTDDPEVNVTALSYSPDGKYLLTSGYRAAFFLNAATGELIKKWPGKDGVYTTFSNNGKQIAISYFEGGMDHWDVEAGKSLGEQVATPRHIFELRSLPQSDRMIASGFRYFSVIEPSTGKMLHTMYDKELHSFRGQVVSQDERHVSTLRTTDHHWVTMNLLTGKATSREIRTNLQPRTYVVRAYSAGKRRYGTTLYESTGTGASTSIWLLLIDLATGEVTHQRQFPFSLIDSIAFSPDGRHFATGNSDTTVLIWDLWNLPDSFALPEKITEQTLREQWNLLDGEVDKIEGRIRLFTKLPDLTVALLKEKLSPAEKPDVAKLKSLIRDLGSDRFPVREKANKELNQLGDVALPLLKQHREQASDEEAKTRLDTILNRLESPFLSGEMLKAYRGIEILERIDNSEAKELLKKLAKGEPKAMLTREAKAALRE